MKWNELMHAAKKKFSVIDDNVMMNVLKQFAIVCKKFNIPRMNLIIHLWTLWSAGKIYSVNIIEIITTYD